MLPDSGIAEQISARTAAVTDDREKSLVQIGW